MVHANDEPAFDQAAVEALIPEAIADRDMGISPALVVTRMLLRLYGKAGVSASTRLKVAAINYGHRPGYYMNVYGKEVFWSGESWTDPATGYVLKLIDSATDNHSMSDILLTGYENRIYTSDFTKAVMAYTGQYDKFYQ